MQENIKVNLSTDHLFECETNIIGREGEGNTSRLEITIPEKLCGCSVYLDFEKPNGEKLRTPKLEVESGVAYYDVVPYLLTDEGEIKVQAVLITEIGGIWKSTIKKYTNYHSINAEDYINAYPEREDFLTEAQRVLDELSGEVAEIAEMLSNNQDFIDRIVNTIEDARWVNTINGTRLRFFVGTKADYEALEDKQNLFAIITDDTTKDGILTAIEELRETATSHGTRLTLHDERLTAIEELRETATSHGTRLTLHDERLTALENHNVAIDQAFYVEMPIDENDSSKRTVTIESTKLGRGSIYAVEYMAGYTSYGGLLVCSTMTESATCLGGGIQLDVYNGYDGEATLTITHGNKVYGIGRLIFYRLGVT